jgi:hypothetical protein
MTNTPARGQKKIVIDFQEPGEIKCQYVVTYRLPEQCYERMTS